MKDDFWDDLAKIAYEVVKLRDRVQMTDDWQKAHGRLLNDLQHAESYLYRAVAKQSMETWR